MALAPEPLRLPLAQIPRQLACIEDYRQLASRHLPAPLMAWIDGGSGAEEGCCEKSPNQPLNTFARGDEWSELSPPEAPTN